MPFPVVAIAVSTVVKNPKILIGAAAAVVLPFILIVAMLGGLIGSMGKSAGSIGQQTYDEYCKNSSNSTNGGYTGQAYEGSVGGDILMKFLKEKGLTYNQAHVVWALGMRESGAQNYVSSTPGFNGGYGVWQIEKPHAATARKVGMLKAGVPWTMEDIGADMAKNYEVMWWLSNHLRNLTAWGLAGNQPPNSILFDWRIYEKIPGWMNDHAADAETVYRKWYNQFAAAVKKNGIRFVGDPTGTVSPTPAPSSSAPPFVTNPVKPGTPTPPPLIAKPKPVQRPVQDVAKDPLGRFPAGPVVPTVGGGAVIPAYAPNVDRPVDVIQEDGVGIITVEGHVGLKRNDPSLETFEVGGWNWTVAGEWVPTFRAFLMDWEASPALGGGRLTLTGGSNGSYAWRKATMSPHRSDHAGFAIDIRTNILAADQRLHMTAEETQATRAILQKYPALGWGGDYGPGAWDEMHVYIRGNAIPGDSVGVAVSTFIVADDSLDPMIGKNGVLDKALAQYPYTVDTAKGRTIPQGVAILDTNQKAQDAGVWIVSLGAEEAQIGKTSTQQGPLVSHSPSPSSPELLKPDVIKGWIEDVMNLSGGKQVYWVQEFTAGPSQGIINTALTDATRTYKNLSVIAISAEPSAGYVTDKGVLTPLGAENLSNMFQTSIADAQPAYTARADCAKYLFGGNSTAVLDGPFQDRTDVIIPNATDIVARAESYVGTNQAPCGRCIGVCDHLAGVINTGVNGASMYDSAKSHWQHTIDGTGQYGTGHPDDKSIPLGAVVFFTASANGHVATYVGGGWVVSNYQNANGPAVMKVPLKDMAAAYGYLGWADPVYPGPGH